MFRTTKTAYSFNTCEMMLFKKLKDQYCKFNLLLFYCFFFSEWMCNLQLQSQEYKHYTRRVPMGKHIHIHRYDSQGLKLPLTVIKYQKMAIHSYEKSNMVTLYKSRSKQLSWWIWSCDCYCVLAPNCVGGCALLHTYIDFFFIKIKGYAI